MKLVNSLLFFLIFTFFSQIASAQTADSTQNLTTLAGSVGFTNNGFSIIPSFSLNSPAFIASFGWRKKRFSFDPDLRLVPDATKGGLLFWFRYRVIENKKFGLRLGAHPAVNLLRHTIYDSKGTSREITELLRFAAFEIVPSYQVSKHFGVSAVYLQGHGLQKNFGPQFTNVLFLNSAITNIGLSENLKFNLFPSVFFLQTDGQRGDYFTLTGALVHKKLPFSVSSTINKTIKSNLNNNRDFMWNVALNYNFRKVLKTVK